MAYPYYQNYQNPYYLPVGYQPVQAQQQTSGFSSNQTVVSSSGIIWVDDGREAAMYPIAPNNAVALWDKSGKIVYLKQADATGKPSMKTFDLIERCGDSQESAKSTAEEYATKKDLAAIDGALSAIKTDIETMRSDLYGVAGRKRSVKKEVTEDDE